MGGHRDSRRPPHDRLQVRILKVLMHRCGASRTQEDRSQEDAGASPSGTLSLPRRAAGAFLARPATGVRKRLEKASAMPVDLTLVANAEEKTDEVVAIRRTASSTIARTGAQAERVDVRCLLRTRSRPLRPGAAHEGPDLRQLFRTRLPRRERGQRRVDPVVLHLRHPDPPGQVRRAGGSGRCFSGRPARVT